MEFHRKLHAWYQIHGRKHLPWRNTSDPYAIWVSEIMLQQTQVKTVLERFYHPFLEKFPTIEALAHADFQEVAKAWEGLGYYARARNLHQAAGMLVSFHFPERPKALSGTSRHFEGDPGSRYCASGECAIFPASVESLQSLPGIGKNTAHAIAAFAFHQPLPVMEANLKRVLARVFAMKNITSTKAEKQLWNHAYQLLDRENPFDYNQAMMDIGALVCSKRNPLCDECPLSAICKGKTAPEAYPAPKLKKQTPLRERMIYVYRHGEKYFIQRRTSRFLHGLWGFVELLPLPPFTGGDREGGIFVADASSGTIPPPLSSPVNGGGGAFLRIEEQSFLLGSITQTYSHFQLQAEVHLVPCSQPANLTQKHYEQGEWLTLENIEALPLSNADKKVVELIRLHVQVNEAPATPQDQRAPA